MVWYWQEDEPIDLHNRIGEFRKELSHSQSIDFQSQYQEDRREKNNEWSQGTLEQHTHKVDLAPFHSMNKNAFTLVRC